MIRIFRLLGWVLLLVFFPCLLIALAMCVLQILMLEREDWRMLLAMNSYFAAVNAYLIALLVAAHRMSRGHTGAKRLAQSLCCIMLLGFPLFTLVGLILLRDIHRHYDAFCRAVTEGNSA